MVGRAGAAVELEAVQQQQQTQGGHHCDHWSSSPASSSWATTVYVLLK
jgi:hypothetical protein